MASQQQGQPTNIPVSTMDVDDVNMGMSSGFYMPPPVIPQGPLAQTSTTTGQNVVFLIGPAQPPLPPLPPTPTAMGAQAGAVGNPSFGQPAWTGSAPNVPLSTPTTRPGQFLSHSARPLTADAKVQNPMMYSVPSVLPRRRITVSDENGIDRDYVVNNAIWSHVKALVENAEGSTESSQLQNTMPVFTFGVNRITSLGSLPSAALQYSSHASFGSTGTQASGGPQTIPRYEYHSMISQCSVDPLNAIREQCQILVEMGRTNDIARITQELNMFSHGQVSALNLKFVDEVVKIASLDKCGDIQLVSNCDVTVDGKIETNGDIGTNGYELNIVNNNVCNGTTIAETCSVVFRSSEFRTKPKSGVLRNFNLVLRRMFHSKL